MAINPETQFPGKIKPSSVDYPYGEAQNISVPGDGTGTPWEAVLLNDIFGQQQSLLSAAGVVPSGTPDKVNASQYLESVLTLSGRNNDAAGTVDVLTITNTPALILLNDKQLFYVVATGKNLTTTPTLKVDALAAKTIVKYGNQALNVGDIPRAGYTMMFKYDLGNDVFQYLNPALEDVLSSETDENVGSKLVGIYRNVVGFVGLKLSEWIAERPYNMVDFGVKANDSNPAVIAANGALMQAAIDRSNDQNIPLQLPGGTIFYNTTITVPTAVRIFGTTKGFSSNTSSTLDYSGTGVGIHVTGNYVKLENFMLLQGGTGTIGVLLETNYNQLISLTIMNKNTFPGWSVAGVTTTLAATTTFTHILRDCYIFGNVIGAYFNKSNNVVLDACFLESNGTNLKALACNSVCLVNGTVIELFGDGRAAETNTSVALDIEDTTGFVCRDYYSEIASLAVSAIGQRFATLKNVKGGCIESGIMTCQGINSVAFSPIEIADSDVVNLSIKNNFVSQLGTDATIVEATGSGNLAALEIANNQYSTNAYEYDRAWTPSLLVGGNAAGVTGTFKALFAKNGSYLTVSGRLALTSKGVNAGNLTIGNLPLPCQPRLDANEFIMGTLLVTNNGSQTTSDSACWLNSAKTEIGMRYRDTVAGAQKEYDEGDIGNGSSIYFEITYPVEP